MIIFIILFIDNGHSQARLNKDHSFLSALEFTCKVEVHAVLVGEQLVILQVLHAEALGLVGYHRHSVTLGVTVNSTA